MADHLNGPVLGGIQMLTRISLETRVIGGILDPSLPLFLYGAGADSFAVRRTAALLDEFGHADVRFVVNGLEELLAAGIDAAEGPEEDAP